MTTIILHEWGDDTVWVIYPLRIQFDVLHRLRLRKQNNLFYDVHFIIDVDGFMEFSIIWKTEKMRVGWNQKTLPLFKKWQIT